jgi:hypothetical protein
MKLKLIENWRNAWKWFSIHAMVCAAAIQGAWLQVSDDMKAHIPSYLISGLTIALLILGIVGRVIKQGAEDDKQP